ncbi:hypothetical protein HDU97_010232 [Phlyctochytrium planicorne]|nr:hypothetical protein HDU97_010232 [Phlyctochytrium planicorne]
MSKGIFSFSSLPKEIEAGSALRVWVYLKLAAPVDADSPITFQLVGLAKCAWTVTPDSPYAAPEDRAQGRNKAIVTETEFYNQTVAVCEAKLFEKGEHAYMASIKLDPGLFPTYNYQGQTAMAEFFNVRYIVRAFVRARDNPVPPLEKEIVIKTSVVDGSFLDPLVVSEKAPSGAYLELRSARSQWIDRDVVTVFSSIRSPQRNAVAKVFLEIMQKFNLPDPMGPGMLTVERIFATFELPGCPPNANLDSILKLNMPQLPPTMEVGPILIEYSIRAVVLQAGNPQPPVEFICSAPILVLPPVQLQIDPNFDETDPDPAKQQPEGAPIIPLKANVSPNPVQRFVFGGGQPSPQPSPQPVAQMPGAFPPPGQQFQPPPSPQQQQQQFQNVPPSPHSQQQQGLGLAPGPPRSPSPGRRPLPQPGVPQQPQQPQQPQFTPPPAHPQPVQPQQPPQQPQQPQPPQHPGVSHAAHNASHAHQSTEEQLKIKELENELRRLQKENEAYLKGSNQGGSSQANRTNSSESISEPKSFADLRRKTVKAKASPVGSPITPTPSAAANTPKSRLANVVSAAIANLPERSIQLPAINSTNTALKTPAANDMSSEQVNKTYTKALEDYRSKLLDYLTEVGSPMIGRDRQNERSTALNSFKNSVTVSPAEKDKLVQKLEVLRFFNDIFACLPQDDMRRVETDLGNAYEISIMHGLVDGMKEGRRQLRRGIEVQDIVTPEDLAESLDSLKLTLREKAGENVPLRVWEKALEKFETDVKKPLEADLAAHGPAPIPTPKSRSSVGPAAPAPQLLAGGHQPLAHQGSTGSFANVPPSPVQNQAYPLAGPQQPLPAGQSMPASFPPPPAGPRPGYPTAPGQTATPPMTPGTTPGGYYSQQPQQPQQPAPGAYPTSPQGPAPYGAGPQANPYQQPQQPYGSLGHPQQPSQQQQPGPYQQPQVPYGSLHPQPQPPQQPQQQGYQQPQSPYGSLSHQQAPPQPQPAPYQQPPSPYGSLSHQPQPYSGQPPQQGYTQQAQPYGTNPQPAPPQQPQQYGATQPRPAYGYGQHQQPQQAQPQPGYGGYASPHPLPQVPGQPQPPPHIQHQVHSSHIPVPAAGGGAKSSFFPTQGGAPARPPVQQQFSPAPQQQQPYATMPAPQAYKDPRICSRGDCQQPKATGSPYCPGCQRIVTQNYPTYGR